MRAWVLMIGLAATGCAALPPHQVTLMAGDGSGGSGQATRGMTSGIITLDVDGKPYSGTWVAGRNGMTGFASSGSAFVSGMSASTTSGGTALLRSPSGGTLRCQFSYDGLGHVGFGECVNRAGKRYEMQIT